jgi:hypothetical protein
VTDAVWLKVGSFVEASFICTEMDNAQLCMSVTCRAVVLGLPIVASTAGKDRDRRRRFIEVGLTCSDSSDHG